MQRLGLSQNLQQKLSPQQIQFIKLLQVPTAELENRIEEEMEINPALEEGPADETEENPDDNSTDDSEQAETPETAESETEADGEVDIKDYLEDDDYTGFKSQPEGDDEEEQELPIPMASSLHENLSTQLGFLGLDDRQHAIGKQLVGSIESDGYIRRDLEAIVNACIFLSICSTSPRLVSMF